MKKIHDFANLGAAVKAAQSAATSAKEAAKEAFERRKAAKLLKAEADEIQDLLLQLKLNQSFVDEKGLEAKAAAEARLAEIKANEDYQTLMAEIKAKEKADAERQLKADLAKREAKQKADQARAKAEAESRKVSKEIFKWVKSTGPNRLGVICAWFGKGVARAAVRLEKDKAADGRDLVRISSVKGETELKVGQNWILTWTSVPKPLRAGLARAEWITPPEPKGKKPGARTNAKAKVQA